MSCAVVWCRRSTLVLLVAALAPRAAQAQDRAVVSGIVRNAATGEPVRLAVVRAADNNVSTLSNDAGRYRLELSPGTHRLDVRRLGFTPASVQVVVAAAERRSTLRS